MDGGVVVYVDVVWCKWYLSGCCNGVGRNYKGSVVVGMVVIRLV